MNQVGIQFQIHKEQGEGSSYLKFQEENMKRMMISLVPQKWHKPKIAPNLTMLVLLEPSRVGEQHTRSINEGTKQHNHKAREKRGITHLECRERER